MMPFGVAFAFKVELLFVIHALELAKEKTWDWIWLACDSKYVVDLINSKSHKVPTIYRGRWSLCLNFVPTIYFRASHIYLEGNHVANCQFKHALQLSQQQWWYSLPIFCVAAYKFDLYGPLGAQFIGTLFSFNGFSTGVVHYSFNEAGQGFFSLLCSTCLLVSFVDCYSNFIFFFFFFLINFACGSLWWRGNQPSWVLFSFSFLQVAHWMMIIIII